jgi:hypothetical protein
MSMMLYLINIYIVYVANESVTDQLAQTIELHYMHFIKLAPLCCVNQTINALRGR